MSKLRLYPFPCGTISPAPIYKWGFSAARVVITTVFSLFVLTSPVLAHHPVAGKVPANFFEGFLSGLAHPILGPDHVAFVVAAGLLASIPRCLYSGCVCPNRTGRGEYSPAVPELARP